MATTVAESGALIGTAISLVALYFGYTKWKADELRRTELHKWADEVIFILRKLVTVCSLQERHFGDEELSRALNEVTYATTALVDRGRLFFRNQVVNGWGENKDSAHRGFRSAILDPVLISHHIACNFKLANSTERARMFLVANQCANTFVSLAQKEVGRVRTISNETKYGGDAISLRTLMNDVKVSDLTKALQTPRPYIK